MEFEWRSDGMNNGTAAIFPESVGMAAPMDDPLVFMAVVASDEEEDPVALGDYDDDGAGAIKIAKGIKSKIQVKRCRIIY